MSYKIVVTASGGEKDPLSELIFEQPRVTIGRANNNDVVLPDPTKRVSSQHARIERQGTVHQIFDQNSTNGTFLNDQRIEPGTGVDIKEGDRISIGAFHLHFHPIEEASDQTLVLVDLSREATNLADEVNLLYARNLRNRPEKRREVIRKALENVVGSVGAENARSILSQILSRFETGKSPQAMDRGTLVRRKDEEIQQREELFQAGSQALLEIASHFLGVEKFESAEQVERFARLINQSLDLTIEWISKSLQGRREFENQFSADLTMIFATGQNPIKSGGTPEQIGRFLLDYSSVNSDRQIRDSLEGAFRDLTMHQLGLIAGVQESLGAVLQRLEPGTVEKEVLNEAGGGISGMMAKMKLAKRAWEKYTEVYQEIFAENSKLFNEMIYPNVRKGYLASHAHGGESTGTSAPTAPGGGGDEDA